MKQLNASVMHRAMFMALLMVVSACASADEGHDKPAADMNGMDHSKMDMGKMAMGDGHWMAPPDMAKRPNPVKATPASIARGKKLYAANCASCHGATGAGDGPAGKMLNPKPAELATMAPKHPPGDLAWKIENGRGAMPAWKASLKPNQIWDVVNYLQNMTPPKNTRAGNGRAHTNDGAAAH